MAHADAGGAVEVEVVYALPDMQQVVAVPLPATGLTVLEAVERSGLREQYPEIGRPELVLAVFGVVRDHSYALRPGDRVEILRPLRHDPRALRRERAAAALRKGTRPR
jgi:putative ubiquitin-RnfH superfamily antitoxin RatB of RatAB toxin-antitoxin module